MEKPGLENLAHTQQSLWAKAGYRFASHPSSESVDIESLIIESIEVGRNEPAILWALLTWMTHFSDLINISRLSRLVKKEHEPVLGALAETALENGADGKLEYVKKKCRPNKNQEILFHVMKQTHATSEYEISNCLPIFRKWGICTSSISIKDDALRSRAFVLRSNPNLAMRAVFGTSAKAEVLYALSRTKHAYISQLATGIGLSYQPVYAEVNQLILNGMLEFENIGRAKLVWLAPKTTRFLRHLPA